MNHSEIKTEHQRMWMLAERQEKLKQQLAEVEKELLHEAETVDSDDVVFPGPNYTEMLYTKEYVKKHKNAFEQSVRMCLDPYTFEEWAALEDFLGVDLEYSAFCTLANYCNANKTINGEILSISEFPEFRKRFLRLLGYAG
jgi:hypothetical protein